ncbi:MAG: hypothetical protein WBV23_08565 [Desulfobaccales bacterium]
MLNFSEIFDFVGLPHGLSLEDARQDWDRTVGRFLSQWEPPQALQIWKNAVKKFLDTLEAEAAENIMEGLLLLMKTRFLIDPIIIGSDYRQNLDKFDADYQFRSKSGDINVLVKFHDGQMDWEKSLSEDVNATLEFKDGQALINYLFNYVVLQSRDFLQSIINNEIRVSGNLNYLYKFLFMANHMLLEATGDLP